MKPGFFRKLTTITVAAAGLTAGLVHSQETINLTLQDALTAAVRKNLEVQAELFNPAIDEAEWRKQKGIYDPKLTLLTDYRDSRTVSTSRLVTGQVLEQETLRANPGIKQLLPTGGEISLIFNNEWNRSAPPLSFTSINNYWQSDVTLSLSQPLLKNFGRAVTNINITVAEYNKYGSFERFKSRLVEIVAQVRNEYFKLYSLQEDVLSKRVSLELANKILDDTKGRVRAGVLPAVDVLSAEFGAAQRERELLNSYRDLQDQMDLLRLLLQLPQDVEVIPVDQPNRSEIQVNEEEAIKSGLTSRPDVLERRIAVKGNELIEHFSANQKLPELKLLASGATTGLGETYGRDTDRLSSGEYPVWSAGLQFEFPIGNREARNEHIRSKLRVGQAQAQLESLEKTVRKEIITAIRALNVRYKQIALTERGRVFAEENLRAFIRKNEVGLATTKDVLDVEEDLAKAKSDQITAVVEYSNAMTEFYRVTGQLLEKEVIVINPKDAEQLYSHYK